MQPYHCGYSHTNTQIVRDGSVDESKFGFGNTSRWCVAFATSNCWLTGPLGWGGCGDVPCRLRAKHPYLFADQRLLFYAYALMGSYRYRLPVRRFIQELFAARTYPALSFLLIHTGGDAWWVPGAVSVGGMFSSFSLLCAPL